MINHFLATLDNDPNQPDGLIWPTFTPRIIGPDETTVRSQLIGVGLGRQNHLLRCLQLTQLVAESPLSSYLTVHDHRITYTIDTARRLLGVGGVVVQYSGTHSPPPTCNLVINTQTPDAVAYTVTITSSTTATVIDDLGTSVNRTFAFSGGLSTPIDTPNGTAAILLSGATPQNGDRWSVSYQKPGTGWIDTVLRRLPDLQPRALMSANLLDWFDRTPLAVDRLAAVIVALGDPL